MSVPEPRLPSAVGVFNAVQGLSIAAGPVLGGVIVQELGWRWTMFVNVPVAVACLLLGMIALREVRVPTASRFDVAGTVSLVVALTALVYALIDGPDAGWTAPSTIGLLALAAVALVAFVAIERRAADPLLPPSLFRDRSFAAGSALSVLAFFALNGGLFVVSLFLLQIQHLSATAVGVRLLPLGLAMLVGAVLSGRLISRLGDRWTLVIGSLLVAAGLAGAAFARLDGGYPVLAAGLTLIGLGLGQLIAATVTATVGNAPAALAGPAAGAQQTAGRLGAALGVAVLGAVMAAATGTRFAELLDGSGLPAALTAPLKAYGSTAVAGGVVPLPPGAAAQLTAALTGYTDSAFLSGMRITLLVGALIAAAGSLIALGVRRRPATVA